MKKTGFTLVELLAVIVILAIILAIAVPSITGVISNATKDSFRIDTKMVLQEMQYKLANDSDFDITTIDEANIESILGISAEDYQSIEVTLPGEDINIVIIGKNKWNGLTAYGTIQDINIVDSSDYDVTAPVITILGENPVNIHQGEVYSDAGATANDNHDGDITADIVIVNNVNTAVIDSYTVTYNVSDAAGNIATEVTRTVNVIDGTAPVITLLGENPVEIELGSVYSDAGATAADDTDGNITADIVVTSDVNPNLEGTYTVTYNVSDSAGNEAVPVTRTVTVVNSFDPSDVANLYFWIDSSTLGLNDGDAVTNWPDLSGNNLNVTQSDSAKKPTFKTNVLNGKPVVRFDGSNDAMYVPNSTSSFNFLHNGTGVTIFIVIKDNGVLISRTFPLSTFPCSNNQVGFIFEVAASESLSRVFIQNYESLTASWLIQNRNILGYGGNNIYTIRHGTAQSPDFEFSKNGVLGDSINYYGTPSTSNATNNLYIGDLSTGGYTFNGDIAEIAIYNRLLTNTERDNIEDYLAQKWGITLGS